jgi:MFS family permease
MGVAGGSALLMGRLYDLIGMPILAVVTGLSALFAPLVFFGGFYSALIGMVLWGIGLGSQESIMRAVVANLVPPTRRGGAYGMMYLIFGSFWAVGSFVMGWLYDISLIGVVIFSLAAQVLSIPLFLRVKLPKR